MIDSRRLWTLFGLLTLAAAGPVPAASDTASRAISGLYVEARTSDVYTGPCFANAEVNLAGREAILAWQVERGRLDDVDLAGLGVVAIVRANATLGDPHGPPLLSKAVVLVDERASAEQRRALVELARRQADPLLSNVVTVETADISIEIEAQGAATVIAGDAELRTRALNETDHLCGNEEIYYPPLSPTTWSEPGVTLRHRWGGRGLGATWSSPHKRSAFVGTFER